jgi:hypothetical protein
VLRLWHLRLSWSWRGRRYCSRDPAKQSQRRRTSVGIFADWCPEPLVRSHIIFHQQIAGGFSPFTGKIWSPVLFGNGHRCGMVSWVIEGDSNLLLISFVYHSAARDRSWCYICVHSERFVRDSKAFFCQTPLTCKPHVLQFATHILICLSSGCRNPH